LLPLGQGGLLQTAADALAERLQVSPDCLGRLPLGAEPRLLLALGGEGLTTAGDLLAAIFQLRQVDGLRLVGVEQALFLAVESSQLRLPFFIFDILICLLNI